MFTYDIEAPKSFVKNESFKKRILILLEKTSASIKNGMFENILNSLKLSLD